MRKTSECNDTFSFNNPLLCYICFMVTGETYQLPKDMSFETAYGHAIHRRAKIILIWPDKYSTDAFVVDNLIEFAKAKGIITVDLPVKIINYQDNFERSTKLTRCIDVYHERTDTTPGTWPPIIQDFDAKMKTYLSQIYGWRYATSKGNGHTTSIDNKNRFTVYVKH